jgi:hypothetical protein
MGGSFAFIKGVMSDRHIMGYPEPQEEEKEALRRKFKERENTMVRTKITTLPDCLCPICGMRCYAYEHISDGDKTSVALGCIHFQGYVQLISTIQRFAFYFL